jgi:hypothetical protein
MDKGRQDFAAPGSGQSFQLALEVSPGGQDSKGLEAKVGLIRVRQP